MLLRKLLLTGAIVSFTMAGIDFAQAETVQDHYKTVIDQTPYSVEVCNNVTTSGDKTGDALTGAILGSIIGNNIKGEEDGGAIGAVIGGLLGHSGSTATGGTQRVCSIETRYQESQRTVYAYSTVTFVYEGKQYSLRFNK